MKMPIPPEKLKTSRHFLPKFASLLLLSAVTPAVADTLFTFSTTKAATASSYNPSLVSVSLAEGLSGPSSSDDITTAASTLSIFRNSEWDGFSVGSGNGPAPSTPENWFTRAAFVFTLTLQPGYAWDLTSLDFLGARGRNDFSVAIRGFEIFASIDGTEDYNSDFLFSEPNIPGEFTRTDPYPYSIELTDPRYADATSITFRYIPLTSVASATVEFDGFTVNGNIVAVPEPGTWVMLTIGLGILTFRLRRLSSRGNPLSSRL